MYIFLSKINVIAVHTNCLVRRSTVYLCIVCIDKEQVGVGCMTGTSQTAVVSDHILMSSAQQHTRRLDLNVKKNNNNKNKKKGRTRTVWGDFDLNSIKCYYGSSKPKNKHGMIYCTLLYGVRSMFYL